MDYTSRSLAYLQGIEEVNQSFYDAIQANDFIANDRAGLVNDLAHTCYRLGSDPDTLHYAVSYFDRANSVELAKMEEWVLMGFCAFFIAGKYEEVHKKDAEQILEYMDCQNDAGEMLEMETKLVKLLDYKFGSPTTKTFLRIFMGAIQNNHKELEDLCCYLSDLSLLDDECLKFKPSLVAASVLFLAKALNQPALPPWDSMLEEKSHYKPSHLKECVELLHELLLGKKYGNYDAIRNKYEQLVATLNLLPEIPPQFFHDN